MCGNCNCCPNINDKRNYGKPETKINGKDFEEVDSCFTHVSKSICKISHHIITASGFLMKFLIEKKWFFFLVSNDHVITEDMIKNEERIFVFYNNENNKVELDLNKKESISEVF